MSDHQATHDQLPMAQAMMLRAFQKTLETIAIHRCPVGLTPFYDTALFPWADGLERATADIVGEYEQMAERVRIPALEELSPDQRFVTNDKNWKSLMLMTYEGGVSPLAEEVCPKTLAALKMIPGVRMAFFSILEPGKKLPAHRGPYRGILRCHLGIKIPTERERCKIRVDKEWRSWEEGKLLILDDSYDHEVDNDTNERRVVLFVDFVRPLKAPFDRINAAILKNVLDRASFAVDLADRQKAWEESVRKEWAAAADSSPDVEAPVSTRLDQAAE